MKMSGLKIISAICITAGLMATTYAQSLEEQLADQRAGIKDKTVKTFTLKGDNICPAPEVAGKAACEAMATLRYPTALEISCNARDVEMDDNCEVTSAVCECEVTY